MNSTRRSVAMVAAALCLSACGDVSSSGGADITQRAESLYDQISGNRDQREALHYLQYQTLNADYHACLAEHGERVSSAFVPIWTGYTSSPFYGALVAPLDRPPSVVALARRRVDEADREASASAQADASRPSFQQAAAVCDAQHGREEDLPARPEASDPLLAGWTEMLTRVEAGSGSLSDYEACMADAGVALETGDGQGYWALVASLERRMPRPPDRGQDGSQAWEDYLAFEGEAMSADRDCRETAYAKALELFDSELEDFEAERADEIEATARGWAAILNQAREAGFVPTAAQ